MPAPMPIFTLSVRPGLGVGVDVGMIGDVGVAEGVDVGLEEDDVDITPDV